MLKGLVGETEIPTGKTASVAGSALSNSEVVEGLKQALGNGVESSIKALGKPNGFLGNSLVEIPVPDTVKPATDLASKLGGQKYVDNFVASMNRAAEQAVPDAAEILGDAIRNMSVEDAMGILNGPEDAATQYFRKTSEAQLTERFLPVVKQATSKTGVTSAYKAVAGKAGGVIGGFMGGSDALDLDTYVTKGALDGLFKYIALEEKSIRTNPLARSTDLLKRVFGG